MQPSPAASRHLNPAGSIAILAILTFLAATSPLSAGSPVATTVTTLNATRSGLRRPISMKMEFPISRWRTRRVIR